MEGGIVEEDCDEFEKLLGEIPNATNHLSRQSNLAIYPQGLNTISLEKMRKSSSCTKSSELYENFPQPATNGRHEFPEVIHREENSNLPDEKCLTELLEGMSIENNESALNHTFLRKEPNVNGQNNTFGFDAIDISFPLANESPIMTRNELMNPSYRFDGHFDAKLFNPDDIYEPNRIPESLLANLSQRQPVNNCFNTYQLRSTAHGVQLPNVYHPNYNVDTQSPPTHIAQPGMLWHSMEEERFGHSYQQYLYAQHSQHQRPEVRQSRMSMNIGMGPFHGNTLHQCFELPIPQHLELCNQNLHPNDNTIYDKSNLLDCWPYQCQQPSGRLENFCSLNREKVLSANGLSCPVKDFKGHQILEVGKKNFPEKILTRPHDLNSIRVLGPNHFTSDQPLMFDENALRWSNGYAHQPYGLNYGSLQLDDQSYRGSCTDVFYSGLSSKSMLKKYNSVDEVSGRIFFMAKDQHGCRFLQRKFAEGNQEDINKIFSEIIFNIVELMTDPFGNYLVQKLLEVCNEEKMMLILKVITKNNDELIRISCDMHGTRAVQKIIETVRTPEQISIIVLSLAPNIILVMKHINGCHVAQRCLHYLSKYSKLLIDTAISHCVELATDRQGCCVLQKCLVHSDDDQKKALIAEISSYSLMLSKDQYGNYVVQFVLELKDPWATSVVLKQLMGNYEHLSVQKYSSNVVEKCLKLTEKDTFAKIIQELMRSSLLPHILQDPYGNYVMQTALSESKVHEELHTDLVEAIISHASTLRSSPYGKKVLLTALFAQKK